MLEVEIEAFETIIWILVIKESKKKKDVKKKVKEIKQLNNKNERTRQMLDDMKHEHEHEEAARKNDIELEKASTTVSEIEVCIEMVKKEEHNKEL